MLGFILGCNVTKALRCTDTVHRAAKTNLTVASSTLRSPLLSKNARPKMAGCGSGAGGYDDYYDDWEVFTAEQLDQLEQDAIRQLAERKASSAAASTARAPALPPVSPLPPRSPAPATVSTPLPSSPFGSNHPAARASLEARFGKVRVLPRSFTVWGCALGNFSMVKFIAHCDRAL